MKTTSLELSQRLKALGVPQQSTFYWYLTNLSTTADWILTNGRFPSSGDFCSSHSSDELGEWLPFDVIKNEQTYYFYVRQTAFGEFIVEYVHSDWGTLHFTREDTLAEAMGLMLEYLIINGYIKVEDLK